GRARRRAQGRRRGGRGRAGCPGRSGTGLDPSGGRARRGHGARGRQDGHEDGDRQGEPAGSSAVAPDRADHGASPVSPAGAIAAGGTSGHVEPAQPPTTTRNVADVTPLRPSLAGAAKTARNSEPVTRRAVAT